MDRIYETLPRSMREQNLVTKVRQEDPEVQKQRQELVRAKSPTELAQMTSLSDFPIPTNLEKLLQKKTPYVSVNSLTCFPKLTPSNTFCKFVNQIVTL